MSHAAPNLLPGEVRAHPDPWQYVVVAIVLAVITAVEIAVSYMEGDIPDGLIVVLLLAMMVVKFFLVASWFMHLRTDQPVFKRLFVVGCDRRPVALPGRAGDVARRAGRLSPALLMPAVAFPSWTAHPDVWLLVGLFAAGLRDRASSASGPAGRSPGRPVVTRFQVTCWSLGVLAMWVASDYPVHDIAERYNFSVHMVQHLSSRWSWRRCCCSGMPAWLLRRVLRPAWLFSTVRTLSRFIPALLIFNVVLVFTHWPLIVERRAALRASCTSAVHALLLVSSLIVWMPIVSPLPEIPRLAAGDADALPVRVVGGADGARVVPHVRHRRRSTSSTRRVPHLFGLSTLEDQQAAGLIMKIGAGLLLWGVIAVVFFRWASEEERANTPRHGLDEMDRELTRDGAEEMTDTTTLDTTPDSEELPELVESEHARRRRHRGGHAAQDARAAPVARPAAVDRDRRGAGAQHLARVPRRRQGRRAGDGHRHHAGDPHRRVADRRRAPPAHVVAGDDPRRRARRRVARRAGVARAEPRTTGEGEAAGYVEPTGKRGRAPSTSRRSRRSSSTPTEYTAPAGIVRVQLHRARPVTRSPSRTRSSTASSSPPTPAARRAGKVELAPASTRCTAPSPGTRPRG